MADKMVVGVSQARQNFFELVALAQEGREILVEKRGKLLVKIVMAEKKETKRKQEMQKAINDLAKINWKTNLSWEKMEKIITDSLIPCDFKAKKVLLKD